jgi:hypothetical protein
MSLGFVFYPYSRSSARSDVLFLTTKFDPRDLDHEIRF